MAIHDIFGLTLTGGDAAAVTHYDNALTLLLQLRNDPVAEVDEATRVDPGLVMGHVLKSVLCVLGTEKALLPDACAALAAAQAVASGATARERGHIAALAAWVDGRLSDACGCWEQVLIDHPDDALAMFAAHQGDFFLGQSTELRDRVARRLPDIARGGVLEGHYSGMYAFGLEETGDYTHAEASARMALQRNPRDAWATHALAHVMEMNNRIDDGIAFLESSVPDWSQDNFFAVHNWWHLALYYADRQQWPAVLDLYDTRLRSGDSAAVLDMIDASSLLWRMGMHGEDVGERWNQLAALWEPRIDDVWYAFNDCHAMMAFAGAGRTDLMQRLLSALEQAGQQNGDNGMMTRAVGLPVAHAIRAFADADYAATVDLLAPVKAIAARAGGSHAQRDLIAQTLLAAAERAGKTAWARALLNERLQHKPHSALNLAWRARLEAPASH